LMKIAIFVVSFERKIKVKEAIKQFARNLCFSEEWVIVSWWRGGVPEFCRFFLFWIFYWALLRVGSLVIKWGTRKTAWLGSWTSPPYKILL
jgi:hypothetical protein